MSRGAARRRAGAAVRLSALAAGTVAALTIGSAAAAQTYSFENPSVSAVYNPTGFTGVTFSEKSGVSAVGGPFFLGNPPDGRQAAFIQSVDGAVGTISLAFTGLTVGNLYSASFYLAQRPNYAVDPLLVSFGGASLGTYSATSTAFSLFTTSAFTATSSSGSLLFTGAATTTGDNDVNIDLVTLTNGGVVTPSAVPEPATWAMMLFGFGGLGFAMRRRPNTAISIRFA